MKTTRWIVLTMLCLLAVACAKKKQPDPKPWQIKSPLAKVLSLRVVEQTEQGFSVQAVVELTNENRVALPLQEVRYQITLDGIGTINLKDQALRTVPANGQQQITLPASFAWKQQAIAGHHWQVSGTVQYEPPGELRQIMTQTYIPLPNSQFQGSGTLQ